jgi:nucleoid DNA-binding protein
MNKVQLIQALEDATDLTKPPAEKIVSLFFNGMANVWQKGTVWKSGDCAPFS